MAKGSRLEIVFTGEKRSQITYRGTLGDIAPGTGSPRSSHQAEDGRRRPGGHGSYGGNHLQDKLVERYCTTQQKVEDVQIYMPAVMGGECGGGGGGWMMEEIEGYSKRGSAVRMQGCEEPQSLFLCVQPQGSALTRAVPGFRPTPNKFLSHQRHQQSTSTSTTITTITQRQSIGHQNSPKCPTRMHSFPCPIRPTIWPPLAGLATFPSRGDCLAGQLDSTRPGL